MSYPTELTQAEASGSAEWRGGPLTDPVRLAALCRCGLLDTPSEEAFDRVTALAARLLQTPVALVTLVEPDRQFFKSAVGLAEPLASRRETPISESLCRYVVSEGRPFVVEDARKHPVVREHPALKKYGILGYLGVPLRAPEGDLLGSLCVIDYKPRTWAAEDRQALEQLAAQLTRELEFRGATRRLAEEEQAHRATRSLTRAALDAISDIFWAIDPEGRLLRWNRRMHEVLGYAEDELKTMRAVDCFVPDHRPRIEDAIARVIQHGHAVVEATLLTKNGEHRPYELNGRPLFDGDGRIVGVCGTARDVEERQAAERALQRSERRFRSFVEATTQVVWRAGVDGLVCELSHAWTDFTGQAPSEVEGWGWTEAVHPQDRARVVPEWRDHLDRQVPYDTEFRVRRHDGVYHWFFTRAVPVFEADGTLVEWVGTCTDIEARRQAKQALQASEQRLRLALEAAQMGTWDVDLQTGRVTWSERTLELFGLTSETFPKDKGAFYALVHEDDRPGVQGTTEATVELAATTGRAESLELEYRVRCHGEIRWFRSSGGVYVDEHGTPLLMTGTVIDITEEKAYETALLEAKEQAEMARERAEDMARLKTSFLNNMSHELRTPLTTVLGFADILADEIQQPHVEMVEMIRKGGHRLLMTLNSVLDLARLESGRVTARPERLNLAREASEVVRQFEPQAAKKGLALEFVASAPMMSAHVDAGAFQRVLMNLLSNAIKFTEEGGVYVRVGHAPASPDAHGCEFVVTVRDTGVGMDEAFLEKAFEPFRQESDGLARKHEGAGLGLSIVQRLAHLMGGHLKATSRKGEGSTIQFYVPEVHEGAAAHAAGGDLDAAAQRAA